MKPIAFCFDLDGTVTTKEILPLIAKEVSLFEEIKLLTSLTLKGLIPFENSFKLRVKLLSTVNISDVCKVVNSVPLDNNITNFIKTNSDDCFILTGNLDVWIQELIEKKLGCGFYSSKGKREGDQLKSLTSILNKGVAVENIKTKYRQVIAIGDSMNDCAMAEKSDVAIAYGGIHEPVDSLIKNADYVVYDSSALIRLLQNYIQKTENA